MFSNTPAIVPQTSRVDETGAWLRLLTPAPQVVLTGPLDSGRQDVEAYIAKRYQNNYGAEVTHFMPWLLSLECLGNLTGVAGMQAAGQPEADGRQGQPLFLERYLDAPVEQVMSRVHGQPVARNSVVEIGNLVAAKRGSSHLLFLLFTSVLYAAGYEHIVFTATRALRNNLQKLGFDLVELHKVDASRLDNATLEQWGNYYATDPVVVSGSLASAHAIIQSRPLLRRVLRLYRSQITALAEQLKRT